MLGDVQRDRSPVAGAVEHRDRDRLLIVGEGRGRERKPGVIVMVRHGDQRHRFFQSQLPAENSRCAPHLDQAALVDAGKIGNTEQSEAGRRFFEDRTCQRGEKRRIIPGCDKSGDVADVAPHAAQRGNHRVERLARIFGGVFVSRKAFFFIVDDDARTVRLRHLNERDAGVVGSGCRKAREIDRRAAVQFLPDRCDSLIGEVRAKPVKAYARHRSGGKPSVRNENMRRQVLGGGGQFVCPAGSIREPGIICVKQVHCINYS